MGRRAHLDSSGILYGGKMHVTLVYPSIGGRVRAVQMQPLTMAALAFVYFALGFIVDDVQAAAGSRPEVEVAELSY